MTASPKILTLDIETSPNIVYRWGLYDQSPVSIEQIIEPQRVICWAAKWHDRSRVEFASEFHDGHEFMVGRARELMSEADIVVHYNGKRFDMPHLRTEFLLAELMPSAPVQEIDLYQVVKSRFRFPSNKLDYVARRLGVGGKVSHAGQALWTGCLAGDPKSWASMKRYNLNDVVIEEQVYDRVRPWITNHPNMALFIDGDDPTCPNCGLHELTKQGVRRTATTVYQRYQCNHCGAWSRGGKSLDRVDLRPAA